MLLRFLKVILLGLMTFSASLASAQFTLSTLSAEEAFPVTVDYRENGATLSWSLPDGYYLYRDHFTIETGNGDALPLETPAGEIKDDPDFGIVEIYRDTVSFDISGTSGIHRLTWQGCKENTLCYPPQSQVLDIPGDAIFTADAPDTASGIVIGSQSGVVDELSRRGGTALVIAGFLVFGLLLSFTPCVFPMFPIVAGMVMGQKTPPGPRRGLMLSGAYVLAMAGAFAGLGVVAAWSGQNLQLALQSPPAIMVAALIFVALGLSMFGVFNLELPQVLTSRLQGIQGKSGSLGGAAILGFTSALIVGPCVTAPLAGALLYISQTGDVVLGAAALFALGLGQGVPLLAIGLFGPRVLPKSGAWMERVKWGFGVVLIGIAIWLIERIIPAHIWFGVLAVVLFITGISISSFIGTSLIERIKTACGTLLITLSGHFMFCAIDQGHDPYRLFANVQSVTQEADFTVVHGPGDLEAALDNDPRPALVYLTADWCTICRGIEKGPLSDPDVIEALSELNTIKVDLSKFTPEGQDVLDMLQAAGPPTMIFLDDRDAEVQGTRLTGKFESWDFLNSIRAAASSGD
jgi:thiol:disulfide interchange protein DsbD